MSAKPIFTIDENFRRISRQKKLKFVVVEGVDDVPIYESCLTLLTGDSSGFDIFSAGGKSAIREFLLSSTVNNAMFVVDNDFNDMALADQRLIVLDRYSIENYFICEHVICHALQYILKCRFQDVKETFSLDDFISSISTSIATLIKVLFFYQRNVVAAGEINIAWSERFICQDRNWELCQDKINALILDLLGDQHTMMQVDEYFDLHFTASGVVVYDFPGKMLITSLQKFIRGEILKIKPACRGKFNNQDEARVLLSMNIHWSPDVKKVLQPIISFLAS